MGGERGAGRGAKHVKCVCVLVECIEYIVLVKKTEVFSILVFSYSLFSQRDLAEIQTPPQEQGNGRHGLSVQKHGQ